ncbi:ABC transporter, ATPase subunit [Candidatus Koribacter versatilis Ellin345]|uniref:ABC transporter, ATPase subunit n=1 Tax=Koribacter versatilis (strain Ellin345) TaxID=204669 RepID=Q1IHY8_KORVE|nr:ATP-binding cassette domain-containing protein [Candidatus Koribacter versatilis]ABF43512.1 ABC transporter, ATPase subunit [Candidatus Koribacter versatilis Ellin345]
MPNTVELRGVTKRYDEFLAVDHISFEIREGSVFGMLGPNGAGKTSTIRMMMGITLPDEGEVLCFGQRFERKHLERIGYMPEERGLYKNMKVLDHLVFLGQLKGLSEAEAKRRAMDWAQRLDIADWTGKRVEELSKGMQQKIQFIATLLNDPPLVIMDEPFSGLDPANAVQLKDVLIELKKSGKTILFSTHRMDTVERLCDTICLVDHGKVVLIGDLKQIKSSYGKNSIQLEYEGDRSFLNDKTLVESSNDYGNYVEIKMVNGADSQALLRLISAKARINKFELVEPSLEAIFIDVVSRDEVTTHA